MKESGKIGLLRKADSSNTTGRFGSEEVHALGILSEAIQAARRMRTLLVLVALLYVGSYLAGWYLASIRSPFALEMSQALREAVLTQQPFTSILESLKGGQLINAIVITILVNLSIGAFLTTTLPGVVPLLGAFGTAAITLLRGLVVGITYPEVLALSPAAFALGLGTLTLELGAYVFSGAAGINIALAPILPRRYGAESRWAAFKMAWKDAARIYVIVALLLVLGAVWEMGGIFLVMRPG
jgi:uncharacterized membrane protein SpoIIM required for sporulation